MLARIGRVARRFACGWTAPAPDAAGAAREAHTLICSRYVPLALCSMKSFDLVVGEPVRWIFHDDGSLTALDRWRLARALPGCRVIGRAEADERAARELAALPALASWRGRDAMALKIVDVALWSRGPVVTYVDTDVLFFRRPDALLAASADGPALFNRDFESVYGVQPEKLDVPLLERANAGLWAMPKAALALNRAEALLAHPALAFRQPPLDQTLTALLASAGPGGAAHLPAPYDLSDGAVGADTVCRHYAGSRRQGYTDEGLAYLFGPLAFRERWSRYAR